MDIIIEAMTSLFEESHEFEKYCDENEESRIVENSFSSSSASDDSDNEMSMFGNMFSTTSNSTFFHNSVTAGSESKLISIVEDASNECESFFGDLFMEKTPELDDGFSVLFGNLFSTSIVNQAVEPGEDTDIIFGNLFSDSESNSNVAASSQKPMEPKKSKAKAKPKPPKQTKAKQVKPTLETLHFCDSIANKGIEAFNSYDHMKGTIFAPERDLQLLVDNCVSEYQRAFKSISDEFENEGIFGAMSGLKELHYYHCNPPSSEYTAHTAKSQKILMKELMNCLEPSLSVDFRGGSMFVRYDDESPQYIRALITGMETSPYSNGIFIFDIYIPSEYPTIPCMVTHVTPGATLITAPNGPGGFSPNMHSSNGKVCLSLLGTWGGLGWEAGVSNLYQVLSSISLMILGAEHAYYMEPGYGGWEDTANIDKDVNRVIALKYNDVIRENTARLCITSMITNPPKGFERVVREHFRRKGYCILLTLEQWLGDYCSCDMCGRYEVTDKVLASKQASPKELAHTKIFYSDSMGLIHQRLRESTNSFVDLLAAMSTTSELTNGVDYLTNTLKAFRKQLFLVELSIDSHVCPAVEDNELSMLFSLKSTGQSLIHAAEKAVEKVKHVLRKID